MQPPQTIAGRKHNREMQFCFERDAKTHPRATRVKSAIAELISSGRRKLFRRGKAVAAINKSSHVSLRRWHRVSLFAECAVTTKTHSRQLFV